MYKNEIMKNLQDIIRESILDDNIGDDSIVQMFFESIMNAKNTKEFKNVALSLKSYLDDEIGSDYKKALNKTKRNKSGYYLAIDTDLGDNYYKIVVCAGPSTVYYVRYYELTNRISVHGLNIPFSVFCSESKYVYVLDDKWNELRKMIINKR